MTTKPSDAPWADEPFRLIATPSKRLTDSHSYVHAASEMTNAHNAIIRGLNAIVQQAPHVPIATDEEYSAQDAKDLLFYVQSWVKMVNHHHWVEESFIFPEVERFSGKPGLMAGPRHQHELFHDGMHRLLVYASTTKPENYRWEGPGGMKEIVDSFAHHLVNHLHDEIDVLLSMKDLDSAGLKRIWEQAEVFAKQAGNIGMLHGITSNTMATVSLDRQIFYTPPAANLKPTSRSLLARIGAPSVTVSGTPLHLPSPPAAHMPQDDCVEISSDDESDKDDLGDSRPRKEIGLGSVAGTGNDVDTTRRTSSHSDAAELFGPGRVHPDDEPTSNQQQQRGGLGCSLEPLSVSPETLHKNWAEPGLVGYAVCKPGQVPAPDGAMCNTTVLETTGASLAEDLAKRHGHGLQDDPQSSAEFIGIRSNHDGTIYLPNDERDKKHPFSYEAMRRRLQARRAIESARKAADTAQPKSVLDWRGRAQSPRSAASNLGVGTQQRSDGGHLSQHHNHRSDSDQTSDPELGPSPAPNSREQNEDGSVVPSQAQESRASMSRLSDDESNNDRERVDAEPPMQPSASQGRIDLRPDIGGHRNTDSKEDYRLVEDSVTGHGQDDDVVQPPRKRRKISASTPSTAYGTAARRQTRLRCPSSRLQQAPRSTQHSKRRRSQRNNPNPLSPNRPIPGKETVKAPVAKFEEWPLGNAVLKRVTVDGVATFQLEFGWNAPANHVIIDPNLVTVGRLTTAAPNGEPTALQSKDLRDIPDVTERLRS
ncbi:hypothetical protein DL767_010759 [Monosporascus sp. MG133]|nr:hypothetical protein DL767_010759 [Monosporascus sp. MG133]